MTTRTRLHVLGVPQVIHGGGAPLLLERKAAALIAYLALEGSTSRARLVGLLWPETTEARARANLRQLVRRLRASIGASGMEGRDFLELDPGLWVDARDLPASAAEDELLAGHAYDDCEALAAWIAQERARFSSARSVALHREVDLLERAGSLTAALEHARRLRALDVLSEEGHRQVMRLCHLTGDQPGALKAFRECQAIFLDELGIAPPPALCGLAEEIERHPQPPGGADRPGPARRVLVPLSVARPPCLAGRAAAWSTLEDAFSARRTIFLTGQAGVGKSRLATDFAASRGRWLHLEARPGDRRVPFSTHARGARALLAASPTLSLPRWIRRQLGRLVPGLESGGGPLPAEGSEDRLAFLSAVAEFFWIASRGLSAIVLDDAHDIDPASAELSIFIHAHRPSTPERPVVINTYRSGELGDIAQAGVSALVEQGTGTLVELAPLTEPDVRSMLESMGPYGLGNVAGQMTRYTGGNPLFVVETAKYLVESGDFDGTFPAALPPPGRIRPIIEQRLARLSPNATTVAQLVAVAQCDLSPSQAASALDLGPLELVGVWRELEAAHILRGQWFTHNLIGEAILGAMPEAMRSELSALVSGASAAAAPPGTPPRRRGPLPSKRDVDHGAS